MNDLEYLLKAIKEFRGNLPYSDIEYLDISDIQGFVERAIELKKKDEGNKEIDEYFQERAKVS